MERGESSGLQRLEPKPDHQSAFQLACCGSPGTQQRVDYMNGAGRGGGVEPPPHPSPISLALPRRGSCVIPAEELLPFPRRTLGTDQSVLFVQHS